MARPKKKIDYELVEKLAHIFCTKDEIAALLGVDPGTLYADKVFQETYKKGREGGKMSLRRMQMKLAEKNTAMAVWLGKQYLGQRDLPNDESAPRVLVVSDVPTDDDGEPLPLTGGTSLIIENDNPPPIDAYGNETNANIQNAISGLGIDTETMNDK